jgi:hypothetical protein
MVRSVGDTRLRLAPNTCVSIHEVVLWSLQHTDPGHCGHCNRMHERLTFLAELFSTYLNLVEASYDSVPTPPHWELPLIGETEVDHPETGSHVHGRGDSHD